MVCRAAIEAGAAVGSPGAVWRLDGITQDGKVVGWGGRSFNVVVEMERARRVLWRRLRVDEEQRRWGARARRRSGLRSWPIVFARRQIEPLSRETCSLALRRSALCA